MEDHEIRPRGRISSLMATQAPRPPGHKLAFRPVRVVATMFVLARWADAAELAALLPMIPLAIEPAAPRPRATPNGIVDNSTPKQGVRRLEMPGEHRAGGVARLVRGDEGDGKLNRAGPPGGTGKGVIFSDR